MQTRKNANPAEMWELKQGFSGLIGTETARENAHFEFDPRGMNTVAAAQVSNSKI